MPQSHADAKTHAPFFEQLREEMALAASAGNHAKGVTGAT